MVYIDTIAVENEVANNMYQRSELDYLIHNDPAAYADLILNGDPEAHLKAVAHKTSRLIDFHYQGNRATPTNDRVAPALCWCVHKKVTL